MHTSRHVNQNLERNFTGKGLRSPSHSNYSWHVVWHLNTSQISTGEEAQLWDANTEATEVPEESKSTHLPLFFSINQLFFCLCVHFSLKGHTCRCVSPLLSPVSFSHFKLLHSSWYRHLALIKDLKDMQVSAALLPFLCFPSDVPPIVLSRALGLLCVLDTSWHVTNGPGHLSAPLSCPLSPTALTTLLCKRGPLWRSCHFSRCFAAKGRREGGSQAARQPSSQRTPLR